jgi:hypothetical protein
MIQVGYTKLVDNEPVDVVDSTVEDDMPTANAALAALQTSLSGRTDIDTLFMQQYVGEDDEDGNRIYNKFAFLDPV